MSKILSIGDTGEEVRRWQEYLISQGFRVNADSKFGASTLAATRAMQRRLGIKADGKVGHRTLDRQSATQATPLPQARPDMPPAPAPPTMADMLTGDKTGNTPFVSSGPEADLNAMHSAASNRAWDQQVSADSVGHDTDMRAEQAAMLMAPQPAPPPPVAAPAEQAWSPPSTFDVAAPPGNAGPTMDFSGTGQPLSPMGAPAPISMDPVKRDAVIRMLLQGAGA